MMRPLKGDISLSGPEAQFTAADAMFLSSSLLPFSFICIPLV